MKWRRVVSVNWFLFLLLLSNSIFSQKILSYVDPYIGSGSHGHVFVVPTAAETPLDGKSILANQDGVLLSSDWYLHLAFAISSILKGDDKNTKGIPVKLKRSLSDMRLTKTK